MRDRLGWSTQSALNFSRVFELFAKSKKIVDFEALTIDASSLYRIAAPSTAASRTSADTVGPASRYKAPASISNVSP